MIYPLFMLGKSAWDSPSKAVPSPRTTVDYLLWLSAAACPCTCLITIGSDYCQTRVGGAGHRKVTQGSLRSLSPPRADGSDGGSGRAEQVWTNAERMAYSYICSRRAAAGLKWNKCGNNVISVDFTGTYFLDFGQFWN